jgi:hypothetical protein
MLIQSVFSLLFLIISYVHPYFVSIWDVEVNDSSQTVQVTCKVFLDDVELGLKKRFNKEKWDWKAVDSDSLTNVYLKESISVKMNNSDVAISVLGKEMEFDIIYIYLESGKYSLPATSIQLELSFLVDAISDQTNLAHIKRGNEKKSFLLNKSEQSCKFVFKND